MNSREARSTYLDAWLAGVLKSWAQAASPPAQCRADLLHRARRPIRLRSWQTFWRWLTVWPLTLQQDRDRGRWLLSAGMHSLAHEMLSLRLVA